jgi:hypothetical protein
MILVNAGRMARALGARVVLASHGRADDTLRDGHRRAGANCAAVEGAGGARLRYDDGMRRKAIPFSHPVADGAARQRDRRGATRGVDPPGARPRARR